MYGILAGFIIIFALYTGCCCFFCCNCCCRGPFFASLRQGKQKKREAQALKLKRAELTRAMTVDERQMAIASVASTSMGSHAAMAADGSATVQWDLRRQQRFSLLCLPTPEESKDEAEPIIDFVENKAQIGMLTPLIFVYAFALGSAIILAGCTRSASEPKTCAAAAA